MNDGGPAFPTVLHSETRSPVSYSGMTLRDWFAGQAFAAVYERYAVYADEDPERRWAEGATVIAMRCFDIADAMLAEREK